MSIYLGPFHVIIFTFGITEKYEDKSILNVVGGMGHSCIRHYLT